MLNSIRKSTLILVTTLSVFSCKQSDSCFIQGSVSGLDYDTLFIQKSYESARSATIIIPVINGKFEYEFDFDQPEAYTLFFKEQLAEGAWRTYIFFPRHGNVKIAINEEYNDTEIRGGKLNKQYNKYRDELNQQYALVKPYDEELMKLQESDEYYSDTARVIMKLANESTTRKEMVKYYGLFEDLRKAKLHATPYAMDLEAIRDSISKQISEWELNFIEQDQSILAFWLLTSKAKAMSYDKRIDVDQMSALFSSLSLKYPDHYYSTYINEILTANSSLRLGGKYIDFEAPDLKGNIFKLSDLIDGKVALIDLWATWCGPCIMTSRSMIPIYQDYKDKGFTVLGVAGEFTNTDRLVKALEREKFPWINLVDLDHKQEIWNKYGISGSGGSTFLVDSSGKILAIHPTAEEVREILSEIL